MSKKEDQKIDKLTPEQEALLPVYEKRYLDIGLSTERCDRVRAEKALKESYVYLNLPEPRIIWTESPFKGAKCSAALLAGKATKELFEAAPDLCEGEALVELTREEIQRQGDAASYGSYDAYWVSFYSFIANELPVQKDKLIDIINEIVMNCGVYWTFDDIIVASEKPKAIHMKEKKLHCLTGKALEYHDGSGLYALNGEIKNSLMEVIMANSYDAEKESA